MFGGKQTVLEAPLGGKIDSLDTVSHGYRISTGSLSQVIPEDCLFDGSMVHRLTVLFSYSRNSRKVLEFRPLHPIRADLHVATLRPRPNALAGLDPNSLSHFPNSAIR